jgi:hypothetical protein
MMSVTGRRPPLGLLLARRLFNLFRGILGDRVQSANDRAPGCEMSHGLLGVEMRLPALQQCRPLRNLRLAAISRHVHE